MQIELFFTCSRGCGADTRILWDTACEFDPVELKCSSCGHVSGELGEVPVREPCRALRSGDLVRHATFGEGVVMECAPHSDDHVVIVQFSRAIGVKQLILSFAPMEKVVEGPEN